MEIISPSVSSATATALAPGVFITTIPRWVAAGVSMLSTPTPARPIEAQLWRGLQQLCVHLDCGADDEGIRIGEGLLQSVRTTLGIWSAVTICQSASCWRTASVAGETFSARTIFMYL